MTDFLAPLFGGALIGIAASIMLYFNGRVTGISGILNAATVARVENEVAWRWWFLGGLLVGGFILRFTHPVAFTGELLSPLWSVIVAGLLVGFGTVMGSGCTSGHGVCGISRLSLRSFVATLIFIAAGILAVVVFRSWGVYP